MTKTITLFHGTTKACADALCRNGWRPHANSSGSQCGNPAYLYLTNHPDNARWYAEQKGDTTVMEVTIDPQLLQVDPEDGTYDTVGEELRGKTPGSVIACQPLPADAFRYHEAVQAFTVMEDVTRLHSRPEDFEEGDLLQRLDRFTAYAKRSIPIDQLDLDEFCTNENIVEEYMALYRVSGTYPPIVFDSVARSTIDGIHRANALARCGVTEIDALVGIDLYLRHDPQSAYKAGKNGEEESLDDDELHYAIIHSPSMTL